MKLSVFKRCRRSLPALASIVLSMLIPTADAVAQGNQDFEGELKLPEIVRYTDLPRRMYLEPEFSLPHETRYVEDSLVEFFNRILRTAPDNEMLIEAIRSVDRVHAERFADMSSVGELLHKHLQENEHHLVQQACASALATMRRVESATEVAKVCVPRYESLCLHLEPEFVGWGGDALQSIWQRRIQNVGEFSDPLVILACNGLAQLQDVSSVDVLQQLLKDPSKSFSVRHASAFAIATLDPSVALTCAQSWKDGVLAERLLGCALLKHSETDSAIALLLRHCHDDSNAVASRAWEVLFALRPSALLEVLDTGIIHADANVRFTAIKVMRKLPTVERCASLQLMTADIHIGVRNLARQSLYELASTEPDLKSEIIGGAGETVRAEDSDWRGLEQSLVLLGQLRHPEWQDDYIRLLDHPRREVFVTAAWLLHFVPDARYAEQVARITEKKITAITLPAHNVQLVFLFQHAGVLKVKSLQPLCEKQFAKVMNVELRAAALWALGKINAGNPDERLVKQLFERIFDDDLFDPEDFTVRRMCVLALVLMDARSGVSELKRVRVMYGELTMLGEAARWALPLLGGDPIPAPESRLDPIGDFAITPL